MASSDLPLVPSMDQAAANGFRCFDDDQFQKPCPWIMDCWPNATGHEMCQCGTIAMLGNDNFPECTFGSMSWLPVLIGTLNIILSLINLSWGLWMVKSLSAMKEFKMNPVTKALVLTMLASVFQFVHQSVETAEMFLRDTALHESMYNAPGVGSVTIGMVGVCMVLSDLAIPLLWIQIASAGMNKADAAARQQRVAKMVNCASVFWFVTLMGIWVTIGTTAVAGYSLLWTIGIMVTFNVGGRKLRKQLTKPGEEPSKTVMDIMFFVRGVSFFIVMYVVCIGLFVVGSSDPRNSPPRNWSTAVGLGYHALAQALFMNMRYIRRSLDKKLTKFQKTGKVNPSTAVSDASSVEA
mmetsp:Transcript_4584/g.8513  ORF Transcript_4584/g.8513 Transcript_4584/m.8513 type:complete len:351 (+) Transcript_4584:1364-2416(+)